MRMGRMVIPVVRKYILPFPKHFRKSLLEAAITEIDQVFEVSPQCSRAEHRGGRRWAAGRRAGRLVSPKRGRATQVERHATMFLHHHHHQRHLCPNHRRQSISKENPPERSRSVILSESNFVQYNNSKTTSLVALVTTTSTAFSSNAIEIASPVTHSPMDFFEKPSVLINYGGSYDQEMFPDVGCRCPQLNFFITAGAKNLIDLNRILLSVKVGINTENGKTRAKVKEHPLVLFSKNAFHLLFSHRELYLNGELISHSSNCYLPSTFIETELTTDTEGKERI